MSYETLGFESGQKLKAEHLNHMEEGIANAVGGSAIIDVVELPTEDIKENAFYRLGNAPITKFVSNDYIVEEWVCHCVNELPDIGKPVSTDMVNITAYYNVQDGEVYGYADSMISDVGGMAVGWYPIAMLAQAFNITWGGIITDIDDMTDGSVQLLLSHDDSCNYYIYKNGWVKQIFAEEKLPLDISWDGYIGDKDVLDMSQLGFDVGTYFVKVSDKILTMDEIYGAPMEVTANDGHFTETFTAGKNGVYIGEIYDGGLNICLYNFEEGSGLDLIMIIYDVNALAAQLGIPTGIYTNGVYFYIDTEMHVSRLTTLAKVTKIPSEYLDIDVDLTAYAKTSNVKTMIAEAISGAIGGSY